MAPKRPFPPTSTFADQAQAAQKRPTPATALQAWDWTGGNPTMDGGVTGTPGWWLDRLSRRLIARNADMMMFTNYYAGDHRLAFMAARLATLVGPHFKHSRVNYCQVVVDKLVERLEVVGFRSGDEAEADDDLWAIWQENALDQEFAKGLREAAVKGEFSIALWADMKTGRPQMRVQDPLNVVVATDPEDRRIRRAGLKRWFDVDMGMWYATLYLPDRIYKFQAKTAPGDPFIQTWWEHEYWQLTSPWQTWVPRQLPGDEPWNFENPYGEVTIIPLPNKPDLQGVGVSELRDIIPIQDKINKLNLDLIMASEFAAFPQKWATNVDLERDPSTGEVKIPWKVGVDRMLTAGPPASPSDAETKFGQFDAAELTNWITALEAGLREIAVISRMPPHYLLGQSGAFPSGESLRAAETGLVQKAKDRWRDFSEPLEICMRLAARIAGLDELAGAQQLETLWRDPETRTESEHLNALTMMAGLGVPKKGLWSRIPATPTEMETWEELLKEGDLVPVPAKLTETEMLPAPGATPPAEPEPMSAQGLEIVHPDGTTTRVRRAAAS